MCCVLASSWFMGRTVGPGIRAELFGEERFTDLDFDGDAVIFSENMRALVEPL